MKDTLTMTCIFIIFGYLSGSILYSELSMLLFKGKSLIEVSQNHNPGASNAYKYGGFWCGTVAVAADLLKGIIPVAFYIRYCGRGSAGLAFVMLAPVLGHAFSCFWKFKGGMSIAVSFGVLLGLLPCWLPLALLVLLFLTMLAIPRLDNSIRSMYAYTGLALGSVILTLLHLIGGNVLTGIFFISAIVCFKMWPDLTEDDVAKIKRRIRIH